LALLPTLDQTILEITAVALRIGDAGALWRG
jgi:hypothetical protein